MEGNEIAPHELTHKAIDGLVEDFLKRRVSNADELEETKLRAIKLLKEQITPETSANKLLAIIKSIDELTGTDAERIVKAATAKTTSTGGETSFNYIFSNLGSGNEASSKSSVKAGDYDAAIVGTKNNPKSLLKAMDALMSAAETITGEVEDEEAEVAEFTEVKD